MKPLINYIYEKLIINKDYHGVKITPTSVDELKKIIKQRYKEQGTGTEQNPIDFNDVDVSNIDSFYDIHMNIGIFERTKFEYIDISDWNVSNVKDISFMFSNCKKLESVGDLSNWGVSNVEDMRCMFRGCTQLKSVGDLSNWNISSIKNMDRMFYKSGIINIPDWYKG